MTNLSHLRLIVNIPKRPKKGKDITEWAKTTLEANSLSLIIGFHQHGGSATLGY